jgi:dephospho-CoA kinase
MIPHYIVVVEPGRSAWKKIKEVFGDEFLLADGTINRDKLGQVIFSDPDKRRLLNSITHPEIYKVMVWKVLGYCVTGRMSSSADCNIRI